MAEVDVLLNNASIECMTNHGFQLNHLAPPASIPDLDFGLPDGADPSSGFRVASPSMAGNDSMEVESSPAFNRALIGDPAEIAELQVQLPSGGYFAITKVGGCLAEAREAVFGSQDAYLEGVESFMMLQEIVLEARMQAEQSPEFANLLAEWSACMASSGFSFTTPLDAWNYPWPDPVGREEVAAATADVGCKRTTDFESRAVSIMATHEQTATDDSIGLLETWSEFQARLSDAMRALP